MRYRVHYTLHDGSADSFIISGRTVEEVRELAAAELARRGGVSPWSEVA